jgi:chemotaxis-related protein WspB
VLFLIFQLGTDHYALEATDVVEVLPLVTTKQIPGATPGVAGVFSYHGQAVPAIDLAEMALGVPAQRRMSTRIIVTRYADQGESHLLGIIAEQATDTMRRFSTDFIETGVSADGTPYLGPVTRWKEKIVQRVNVDRLLTDAVRGQLFRQPMT